MLNKVRDEEDEKLKATKLLLMNKLILVGSLFYSDTLLEKLIKNVSRDQKDQFISTCIKNGMDDCFAEALWNFAKAIYLCYGVGPIAW